MRNRLTRMAWCSGLLGAMAACAWAQQQAGTTASETPAAAPVPPAAPVSNAKVTPIAHVEKRGSGPIPIIMVPGIACEWSVWDTFMTRNAERYTMHAVTLPGFGGSNPPELGPNESHEDLVVTRNAERALIKYIAESGLERPVLMGHGYGGSVALSVALSHPEKVRAVVCVDAMPVIPMADPSKELDLESRKQNIKTTMLRSFVQMTEEQWKSQQYMNALGLVTDDHRARELGEMFNRTDRAVAFHYYLESLLVDNRPRMGTLAVPSFFIAPLAPQGQLTVPDKVQRQQWRAALGAPPNTTLKFYADCRHFVMDDAGPQLDADVEIFLRGELVPDSLRSLDTIEMPEPRSGTVRPPTGRSADE